MTASPIPIGTLAGYRLVRKLGVGSRADVYLGAGSTGPVALKVFAPTTSRESVGAELDALGRVDSQHLVRLRDVSGIAEALPVLVLERVAHGSIAALIAGRDQLEAGEAVTLLAPIAALVAELHDAGVAHGKLGAASIHLGASGRPVLIGLGHCTLFSPGATMAALDNEPAAATDRDALAALALAVLARVRNGPGDRTREVAAWIESTSRAYEFPREIEERLFACAEPLPVGLAVEGRSATAIPHRLAPAGPTPVSEPAVAPDPRLLPARVGGLRLRFPAWFPGLLLNGPAGPLKARALAAARGVRPRFLVAAGGVAVALVLATALVPSAGTSGSVAPRPAAAAPVHTAVAPPSTALPDDPLLASKVLLRARATCMRDRSVLCLDAVDEVSSAAFASDADVIRQVQGGGELPEFGLGESATLTLVESLGDAALIGTGANTHPASILVVRTKAGWRIRDYLSGKQATPAPPSASSGTG